MEIEQIKPNKPNFGLIVGLFCATILVMFVLALLFLTLDGSHLHLRHHSEHPTSRLALPSGTTRIA